MGLNYKYDGTDDHMDSRDIEERINEIEQEHGYAEDEAEQRQDFISRMKDYDVETAEEYEALIELRDDAASANEGWEYGIQFVRRDAVDDEWMKERAVDLGYIDMGGMHEGGSYRERIDGVLSRWPYSHIDWDAATEEYLSNTVEFTFRGVDYFED